MGLSERLEAKDEYLYALEGDRELGDALKEKEEKLEELRNEYEAQTALLADADGTHEGAPTTEVGGQHEDVATLLEEREKFEIEHGLCMDKVEILENQTKEEERLFQGEIDRLNKENSSLMARIESLTAQAQETERLRKELETLKLTAKESSKQCQSTEASSSSINHTQDSGAVNFYQGRAESTDQPVDRGE